MSGVPQCEVPGFPGKIPWPHAHCSQALPSLAVPQTCSRQQNFTAVEAFWAEVSPRPCQDWEEKAQMMPSGRLAGWPATCQEGGGAAPEVNTAPDTCPAAETRPLLTLAAQVPD